MKKIFEFNDGKALIFSILIFLGGLYLFAKIYSYERNLPVMFYILLFICLIIIIIIFLIKRLNYDLQQTIKAIEKSIIITLIINLIGFVILYFTSSPIMCKPCAVGLSCHCPTIMETLLSGLVYTIPSIFLLILLVYLIYKNIKQ